MLCLCRTDVRNPSTRRPSNGSGDSRIASSGDVLWRSLPGAIPGSAFSTPRPTATSTCLSSSGRGPGSPRCWRSWPKRENSPLGRALFALVAHRTLAPASKRQCHERWSTEEVHIWGCDALELHHLHRAMDVLAEEKEEIEKAVYLWAMPGWSPRRTRGRSRVEATATSSACRCSRGQD